jgi:hypothetical protein
MLGSEDLSIGINSKDPSFGRSEWEKIRILTPKNGVRVECMGARGLELPTNGSLFKPLVGHFTYQYIGRFFYRPANKQTIHGFRAQFGQIDKIKV